MESVKFQVIISLNIYSVEFEQHSVMLSSAWVQIPRFCPIFFDLSISLNLPQFRCLVSQ